MQKVTTRKSIGHRPGRATLILILVACSAASLSATARTQPKPAISVQLGEINFVMPQFANPFMERESGIAPHEYEMAEKLRALLDSDSKEAALAELETMLDLELSPALLHLKAQIYFTLGDYDNAEATFRTVLLRMPQFVRAHGDLGQLYLVTDQLSLARKHFAKAVALGENNPVIYGQLGYLNLKLHNAQSAIAAYQNALAIEPENPQWQQGLLSALSQSKSYPAAISFTHEMISSTPENANLWVNKAFLHLQQNENFEALASLETALALGNNDPENQLAAAQLHLQQDSFDRGLGLLGQYSGNQPIDLQLLNQLSASLEQKRRWPELKQLLAMYDNTSDASADQSAYQLLKARTARGLNDHAGAAEHYRAAIAADPSNTDALLSAAHYHYERKNYVEAESLYTRAEPFEQARKEAYLGRARIYIDLKDYESALEVLRKTRAAYPDLSDIARNIELLEKTLGTQKAQL